LLSFTPTLRLLLAGAFLPSLGFALSFLLALRLALNIPFRLLLPLRLALRFPLTLRLLLALGITLALSFLLALRFLLPLGLALRFPLTLRLLLALGIPLALRFLLALRLLLALRFALGLPLALRFLLALFALGITVAIGIAASSAARSLFRRRPALAGSLVLRRTRRGHTGGNQQNGCPENHALNDAANVHGLPFPDSADRATVSRRHGTGCRGGP